MRRSPPLLFASPVEVAERPAGFGSEASDHREPETTDRDRGQRNRADIRNDRKIEDDQGTRERGQQRVGRAKAEPPLQQAPERKTDTGHAEQGGRQHDNEDDGDDRQEDQAEAQERDRAQRQQERCDPRGERDLRPCRLSSRWTAARARLGNSSSTPSARSTRPAPLLKKARRACHGLNVMRLPNGATNGTRSGSRVRMNRAGGPLCGGMEMTCEGPIKKVAEGP